MTAMKLMAILGLNTDEYDEGLENAEKKQTTFGTKAKKAFANVAKISTAAVAAVGVAAIATGKKLLDAVGDVAEYGDAIDKTSQKLGVSSEFYQEWDAVMRHSGTSMETMTTTFKTLSNAIQDTTGEQMEAFEALGLEIDDLQNMSAEEAFEAVVFALQNMEEGTERTALATKLLGREAMDMGALLNTSNEDTKAMIERVHELGGVLSDDAVKASAQYQDSLQDMKTAFNGVNGVMMATFLPGVTQVMDGITQLVTGDEGGLKAIGNGIDKLIKTIDEKLPVIMDTGIRILESLITAIVDNLPKLTKTAVDIVLRLSTVILDNLPAILDAGVDVILAIVDGITEALPSLIASIANVIIILANKLTEPDTLTKIIVAGIALITALISGFAQAVPELIKAVPTIVKNIVSAFSQNGGQMLGAGKALITTLYNGITTEVKTLLLTIGTYVTKPIIDKIKSGFTGITDAGKNLIEGLWNGINDKVAWLKDKISGFASGVMSAIKGFFGIHSPSKAMAEVGDFMAQGLAIGWNDEFKNVKKDIQAGLSMSMDLTALNGTALQANNALSVNNTIELTGDMAKLFRAIVKENNNNTLTTGRNALAW